MKIINNQHVENFVAQTTPENTLWVFDFDATITTPWYDSYKIIKDIRLDWTLDAINWRMFMIYEANSYYELSVIEEKNVATVPDEIFALTKTMEFGEFKHQQMQYRWDYTMKKGIERKAPTAWYDTSKFTERTWASALLKHLIKKGYHVLVLSAWIKNPIVETLTAWGIDCTSNYLHVVANELYGNDNNETIGYNETLVTCFTKNDVDYKSLGIPQKTQAVQLGDSYTDAYMVDTAFEREVLLNIWFSNQSYNKAQWFEKTFDIVVESKVWGFEEILEMF